MVANETTLHQKSNDVINIYVNINIYIYFYLHVKKEM